MTENEWRTSADPARMLSFMRGRELSDRRLLLFSLACCRRNCAVQGEECTQLAIDVTDALVDGISHPRFREAYEHLGQMSIFSVGPAMRAILLTCRLDWDCGRGRYVDEPIRIASAVAEASENPVHEQIHQCAVLRCIYCYPSRRANFDLAWLKWRDGAIVKLAQAAYDERALPSGELDCMRLAVLADALEEAGCANANILEHLRSPGPHVRGCWVIDLLLGKE